MLAMGLVWAVSLGGTFDKTDGTAEKLRRVSVRLTEVGYARTMLVMVLTVLSRGKAGGAGPRP